MVQLDQASLDARAAAVTKLLERHLSPRSARERAGNVVAILPFRRPEDGPLEDTVRDIVRGRGGGDVPEDTIAEIAEAIR